MESLSGYRLRGAGPFTETIEPADNKEVISEAKAWERFHFPKDRFYIIMELGRDQLSTSLISSLIGCH
jgi:hypothetical protein